MKNKLVALLLTLLSANAFAINFPIEISEYMDDSKIDAYINKSDINVQVQWQPFEKKVPLSLDAALKKVQQYTDSNKRMMHSSLIAIELKQIPHHDNLWHYLVKVKSTINDKPQAHFFIVLMDGKIIPAFKEPEAIK